MRSSITGALFRVEAVEHMSARRCGTVVLARPVSFTFLTALFVTVAAALVAFFVSFGYTRKVQVPGVVLPMQGVIRIVSTQAGVIAERRVQEGQAVKAGEVLFVLSSARESATRGDAEKAISVLLQSRRDSLQAEQSQQRRQSAQRVDTAKQRIRDLSEEIQRIDNQRALQLQRVALAEESLKRYADLQSANFISSAQLQDRTGEMLDQRQRLGDLERAKASTARDLASVQSELRDLAVQAERDQQAAQRSIASVEQDLTENEARRAIWVRAPQEGVVTAITADPGQSVGASQSLAAVLPIAATLEAELYAPSRAAGFVKPGMTVLLRYQAYPYQKFGQYRGYVREVSGTAMQAAELPIPGAAVALPPAAASEPLYRVRVSLDRQSVTAYGSDHALKSGMALDASILLEKRRLYEWVLEPLYSITGRV